MDFPATTVTQLATEGIVTVDNLAEFDSEGLKTIVDNLSRPPGTIIDPNDVSRYIPQPLFSFGGKSLLRMELLLSMYDTFNSSTALPVQATT